jgi:hypothetical protein
MELIGIEKYRIYKKYYGDYGELIDHRVGDPKDLTVISEEEWNVIDELEGNLCDLDKGVYSKEMESQFKKKIDELQPLITPEVFQMIKNNESPEPLKKDSLLSRIFGRRKKN